VNRIARFEAPQLSRLRLIDAAALAGISQAALDMSVAYAGTRTQFGRPIGSFQAVKHHCANMVSAARRARDQTVLRRFAIDEGRDDAALQVECALFVAGSAALENAGKNIQIHGGMGFSDEADPHLLLKRAQLLSTIAGGLEAANERIANIKGGLVIMQVAIVTGASSGIGFGCAVKLAEAGHVGPGCGARCGQVGRSRQSHW